MVWRWNFDRHSRFVYQTHHYVLYHAGHCHGDANNSDSLLLPDVCQDKTYPQQIMKYEKGYYFHC